MEEKKINILYIPSQSEGGVFYYRTLRPMEHLKKMFPDKYEVYITNDINTAWKLIRQIDILIIHNCMSDHNSQMHMWNFVVEAKKIGIKTILDIDDFWNYGEKHPLNRICLINAFPVKATVNFNLFDYVTVASQGLVDEVKMYTKNVYLMNNAISLDDKQFVTDKNDSKRIRFGITGGSSHVEDVKQILNEKESIVDYIPKNILDNMQIVLCGFNTKGTKIKIDENGKSIREQLPLDQIMWVQMEKQLTKDYSIVSKEYKDLLVKYDMSDEQFDASNEPYRRIWSKSIANGEYGLVYKDMDVLMAPLIETQFNSCKSVLKFIEAGFTNTGLITSFVKPYSGYGKDGDNCIFIKDMTPKGWSDAIVKLTYDTNLRKHITEKLHDDAVEDFNLDNVTIQRDKLFTEILRNTQKAVS